MPFDDCACHVWAIDGYRDDDAANLANDNYVACAAGLRTTNTKESRQAALVALLAAVRAEIGVPAAQALLWGGFRRGQRAPEHMWIEYDGHVYDTMPGYGLCQAPATPRFRTCPGLENDDFGAGAVCIPMVLTASQLARIRDEDFIAPVHE